MRIDIQSDSRKVLPGDTFIAIKGIDRDGHDYIEKAIENGATKIIAEHGSYSVETVIVENTEQYLIQYLHEHYDSYIRKLKLIGITGTNGKTTSAFLLHTALNQLGRKTGYIGTVGFYVKYKIRSLDNTTPNLYTLYSIFLECLEMGVEQVVLEVSSQAICGHRVEGLLFDYAVFTNLTEDHLDFHKTMENYALAKQQLFRQLKPVGKAIINIDDDYKDYFLLEENHNITFGKKKSDYQIGNIKMNTMGSVFTVTHQDETTLLKTPLIGEYNIYNLMISVIVLSEMGISMESIKNLCTHLNAPVGRMETMNYLDNRIIVDYAHTPDAMEKLIHTVKSVCDGNIYAVFGCTGSREREKRPVMMKIATTLCKYVIVTIDDLHEEEAQDIVADMLKDNQNENYEVELDRRKAIEKGIQKLNHHDILLIMGKGHEDVIIVKDKKIPFNDVEVVKEILEEKKALS